LTEPLPPQIKNDPVLAKIWNDVHRKDKNALIFVCGGTGDCKSGSSITLSDLLDRGMYNQPRFYISDDPKDEKNRIVTSAQMFIKLIKQKLPIGSCIIWDEIGVDADNREYYSLKNRLVKKVFQTFRYKNLIVFMTVPDFNSVDIGVRKLAHGYLEMHGKVGKDVAKGKFQWVDTNPKTGKNYYKYPRYVSEFGEKCKLMQYFIPRPRIELEKPYKILKDKVNKAWYKDYSAQLEYMQRYNSEKGDRGKIDLVELQKDVMKNPTAYFSDHNDKFVPVLLEAKLGITASRAKDLAKLLEAQREQGDINI